MASCMYNPQHFRIGCAHQYACNGSSLSLYSSAPLVDFTVLRPSIIVKVKQEDTPYKKGGNSKDCVVGSLAF